MKFNIKLLLLVVFGIQVSCTDLDVPPVDSQTGDAVFLTVDGYRQFMAKIYAGLAVSGQQGPAGDPDIQGIDEGFSNYIRQYWCAQELTTDEAVIAWADGTLPTYHLHTWTAQNEFLGAMYYRIYFQIAVANEFIRESSDDKLAERGFTAEEIDEIKAYRSEARFMRALSYWHAIDMFGNVPITDENFVTGSTPPSQNSRAEVYEFLVQDLTNLINDLKEPGTNEYGRADKAAGWMLLSKVYLNASVYVGTNESEKALQYADSVIQSGAYTIDPVYQNMFKADNHNSPELIFTVNYDGDHTRTYGGTTFIIHASIGGNMAANDVADYGVAGGWYGTRTTSTFVDIFPDETGDIDGRAIFFTDGQNKEIASISNFNDGYAVPKFINLTSEGIAGVNGTFADTDFPIFRLADAYLIYAEAALRSNNAPATTASVDLINELRQRAYGDESGNIDAGNLTLDFILDERGRELYWECHRRTDLIRFNQFSENGIWPWKGNEALGKTTEKFRDLFPIPSSEITANPNLTQNEGY